MPVTIGIDESAACQAYAVLAGKASALDKCMERTRARKGALWRVPVTRANVYSIESLHRLALGTGARAHFFVSGRLEEREGAFFDDYARHRFRARGAAQVARSLGEWVDAGGELLSAAMRLRFFSRGQSLPKSLESAVIIGAYGGDHIGDAAILGGVLLGLHERYGLKRATVMSARPVHTRRLVEGLSLPIELAVDAYQAARVDRRLRDADALVLGGGPLYDSPRILLRHVAAVETARSLGVPFLVDRIGVVGIGSAFGKWAARRVLKSAARISVRTTESASHAVFSGMDVETAQDPAIDYLGARGILDRLPERDCLAVDRLLAGTEDAIKIGVNLRPTHDDVRRLAHPGGRAMEPGFAREFALALAGFAKTSNRRVVFVFFPMNSIQFGMSDLSAAYELAEAAAGAIDLRVWEGDPSLDGVLHLLRQLDGAIAMRFHATIFALMSNLPVIGIDYFSGTRGKVSQLLADLGHGQDVAAVDNFSSKWLIERLMAKMSSCARDRGFSEALGPSEA